MFKYYRRKTGGLCYKMLSSKAENIDAELTSIQRYVIIESDTHTTYIVPHGQFWKEWEGVETKDLPLAYRDEDEM